MKKKSILTMLVIVVLGMAMFMTACGGGRYGGTAQNQNPAPAEKPAENPVNEPAEAPTEKPAEMTLEDYALIHPEVQQSLDDSAGKQPGLTIVIEGNEIIFTYELADSEGYIPGAGSSDLYRDILESSLDELVTVFGNNSLVIENETGISGIVTRVRYMLEGEVLVDRMYTSADAE